MAASKTFRVIFSPTDSSMKRRLQESIYCFMMYAANPSPLAAQIVMFSSLFSGRRITTPSFRSSSVTASGSQPSLSELTPMMPLHIETPMFGITRRTVYSHRSSWSISRISRIVIPAMRLITVLPERSASFSSPSTPAASPGRSAIITASVFRTSSRLSGVTPTPGYSARIISSVFSVRALAVISSGLAPLLSRPVRTAFPRCPIPIMPIFIAWIPVFFIFFLQPKAHVQDFRFSIS